MKIVAWCFGLVFAYVFLYYHVIRYVLFMMIVIYSNILAVNLFRNSGELDSSFFGSINLCSELICLAFLIFWSLVFKLFLILKLAKYWYLFRPFHRACCLFWVRDLLDHLLALLLFDFYKYYDGFQVVVSSEYSAFWKLNH